MNGMNTFNSPKVINYSNDKIFQLKASSIIVSPNYLHKTLLIKISIRFLCFRLIVPDPCGRGR